MSTGGGIGPNAEDQNPESTTTTAPPPTTTAEPTKMGDGGGGDGAVATGASLKPWKMAYLTASGGGFERLINLLLDNKIFILNMFSGEGSFDPTLDVLGLTAQQQGYLGTGAKGTDEDLPAAHGFEMVDLRSERGRDAIAQYLYYSNGGEVPWDTLSQEKKENAVRKEDIDSAIGTNRYMYQSPYKAEYDAPFLSDHAKDSDFDYIGLVSSFDGTPQGDVRTLEEALAGLSIDRPSLNNKMTNLARENNDYYRGVQAQLSMLGYYGENAAGIEWGIARDIDKAAFVTFVQDMLNTHLTMADSARTAGVEYELEVDDFLATRFSENMTGWIQRERGAPSDTSAVTNFTTDVIEQVEQSLQNAWRGTGRKVTPVMSQKIANALGGVIAEGDLGLDAVFNTDLFGLNVSDAALAKADSFLREFYGGGDDWASNIRLGVQGSHSELRRLANEAGVKFTADDSGRVSTTLDTDTRMNMARLYYHLIDQNVGQGNIESTANHYANMVGYHTFGRNDFDDTWLTDIVRRIQLNPYTEQYGKTLQEQGMQRLEALDTIEKRIMAAIDLGDLDRSTRTRAAYDVFNHLMPGGSNRQRSRFA